MPESVNPYSWGGNEAPTPSQRPQLHIASHRERGLGGLGHYDGYTEFVIDAPRVLSTKAAAQVVNQAAESDRPS